jgi:aryl-alcohol dehydrogenase-like predicted oxidoreductase
MLLKDPDFRKKVFICTKFGNFFDGNGYSTYSTSGKPEYVRKACEESLKNLQVDSIDLYYQHRASLQPLPLPMHRYSLD